MITTTIPVFLSIILSITATATTAIPSIDVAQSTLLAIPLVSTPSSSATTKLDSSAAEEIVKRDVQELGEGKRTGIAVAILIVFFALCVLFGYLFSRARRRHRNNHTDQDVESINEGLVAMNRAIHQTQTQSENIRNPSISSKRRKQSIMAKIIAAILGNGPRDKYARKVPSTSIIGHGQKAYQKGANPQRGPDAEGSARQKNDPHQATETAAASYAPSPHALDSYFTDQPSSWDHDDLPPELHEFAIRPQEAASHKPPHQYARSVKYKKPERLHFWERKDTRSLPDEKVLKSSKYSEASRQSVHTLRRGRSSQDPSTNQKNPKTSHRGGSRGRSQSSRGSHGRSVTSTSRGRRNDLHDMMGRDAPPRKEIIWHEQPKDDGSMIRLLREVDGHLTDHILNYYIAAEGEEYSDEAPRFSGSVCRDLDESVYKWKHLPYQESRIFILRALISKKIVIEVTKATQTSSSSPTLIRVGHDRIYRESVISRIAGDACSETAEFALDPSNNDARLLSMEMVVRTAIDFAFTIENQPIRFGFLWTFPITPKSKLFDPKTMNEVYIAPRPREEQHKSQKVRATVFPGLQKWQNGGDSPTIVAKAQVLLY